MKEIIVDKKYDGKKLNSFLLDSFDGLNLNTLYKALRKKDIRVNDVKVSENVTVNLGDNIKIYISDNQLFRVNNFNIDIIYEDENIVVVNKPAEVEIVGENSLTSKVLGYYKSKEIKNVFIEPCHRLDRNTNGLVLFAKNETALNILLDKFKKREIEKHYRALIYGVPKKREHTLVSYLFKDAKKSFVYISDIPKKGYEKIVTSYKLIFYNKNNNTSILDVNLHTGKTHQIRAHLAHIGLYIIGDGKYGNGDINKSFKCKYQQLCSYSIEFCFTTDSGILNYLNGKKISLGS